MMSFISPRWRRPAGALLIGAVFAAAWVIRGGPHAWLWAALFGVLALGRAFAFWAWAGEDNDSGAIFGFRADERQQLLSQQSWAIAGRSAMIAAFIGLTVAVADKATWWWPFLVILAVTGSGYLLGLVDHGTAHEDPAGSAGTGHQARSPVNF